MRLCYCGERRREESPCGRMRTCCMRRADTHAGRLVRDACHRGAAGAQDDRSGDLTQGVRPAGYGWDGWRATRAHGARQLAALRLGLQRSSNEGARRAAARSASLRLARQQQRENRGPTGPAPRVALRLEPSQGGKTAVKWATREEHTALATPPTATVTPHAHG